MTLTLAIARGGTDALRNVMREIERLSSLVAPSQGGAADAPLWHLRWQHLALSPTGALLTRAWQLSSATYQVRTAQAPKSETHLVPIEIDPAASIEQVHLRTLWNSREIDLVQSDILRALRSQPAHSRQPACVALAKWETELDPLVETTSQSAGVPDVGGRFRLRQFLPVASFTARFNSERLGPLTLDLPSDATADVAALLCRLEFADLEENVRQKLQGPPRSSVASEAEDLLRVALADDLGSAELRVRQAIEVSGLLADDGLEPELKFLHHPFKWLRRGRRRRRRSGYQNELVKVRDALAELQTKFSPEQDHAAAALGDELGALLRMHRPLVVIPATYSNKTSKLELTKASGNDNSGLRGHVRLSGLVVPYTSEREPSTQGKRSVFLLALLSALLLVSAWFDSSWLPEKLPDRWRSAPPDDWRSTVVEPLVSLLVFFPALLYGQFFQTRPRSETGSKAQSGTFALLSLVYALPLAPACLLVAGVSSARVSMMLVVCAFVALAASIAVWRVFRGTNLALLRRSQVDADLTNLVASLGTPAGSASAP